MPQRTPRANAVRLLCCSSSSSFVAPSPAVDGGLAMPRVLGRMRAHRPRYACLPALGWVCPVGLWHTCLVELAFGNCLLLAVAGSDGDEGGSQGPG
ncbi:MAG: hypothetical protein LBL95_03005 [Deltaproteobacteria bacterium]|nr:hypothetical protein [Deltaproteobacteria bacterium]